MTPAVAVLGATGVYGRHLLPRLAVAGYRVRALVRTPAAVPSVPGIEVLAADIFDAASLRVGLRGCEIAVNLATALPSPAKSGGDYELTNRIRRQGVPIFLSACEASGVRRVLQQSIAMIHGGGGLSGRGDLLSAAGGYDDWPRPGSRARDGTFGHGDLARLVDPPRWVVLRTRNRI
jgi:nucleoside-diphosphate-sugar epimerase